MKFWSSMSLEERKTALLAAKQAGQTTVALARVYDVHPSVINHACKTAVIELADGYLVKPPFGLGAKADSAAKAGACPWMLRDIVDRTPVGPCNQETEPGQRFCPEHTEEALDRRAARQRA